MIEFWEQVCAFYGINDVKVMSSCGSSGYLVENYILQLKKNGVQDYSPVIFRQIDRDGLTNEQIKIIEDDYSKKWNKNTLKCRLKFLPVYELENFAVISNSGQFNDDFFDSNKFNLENKFDKTSEAKCKELSGRYGELFGDRGFVANATSKMRQEATSDYRSFFPGKEICSLLKNFDTYDILKGFSEENMPQELKDYMTEVKNFFEISNS